MRSNVGIAVVVAFVAMAGCQDESKTQPGTRATSSATYMTVDEFSAALAREDGLLLVEFCVPSGCFRCDAMRQQVDKLARDRLQGLVVRRVNLNQQPQLAWEFDVKVCPSYVAFRDGEEVFRAAYPTSADLIAAGLDEALRASPAEQLTAIVP